MKEQNVEQLKLETLQMIDKYFMPTKAVIVKDFLNTYGSWDAPASTKYHGNYPGGLAEHSLTVAKKSTDVDGEIGSEVGQSRVSICCRSVARCL